MNLDQVTAAFGEANCKAFLHVIRERESSQDDSAYTVINGGQHFIAPPWRHPWHGIPTTQGAKACGAYQFLGTTWSRVADALGFGEDFRPINQDLGAVFLIAGRGAALDDVLSGRIADACVKCRQEWTSLPGAAEASPTWTIEKVLDVFRHWGGTVAGEQSAAPIEDATPGAAPAPPQGNAMGPAGLILGLVQTALGAFAPLAQQKIQKELLRHTDQATADAVAQQVMAAIQAATGQTGSTPQAMIAATAAVTAKDASPAVVKAAQDDALARLGDMAPFIDKLAEYQRQEWEATDTSMDRAAARNPTTYDMTRPLVYAALGAGGVILLTLMAALVIYALNKQALPEMLLTLIVQTVTGFLGFIALLFAFRFGSSRSSAAKDEMVAQFASRRRTDRP